MLAKIPFLLAATLVLLIVPAYAQSDSTNSLNHLVLQAIRAMPSGGGYSTSSFATQAMERAVSVREGTLAVQPDHAIPSYCSEATYLVFLKVIEQLKTDHPEWLNREILSALRPVAQSDGTGIWGRWNANGPGTARLFYELGLGQNFTDLHEALPGDFLKIFWTDSIGAAEHGHSVIYLGTNKVNGVEQLRFWSSNLHAGYGEKTVPLSRAHRLLFSRFEHSENLARISTLPRSDPYLASLQRRSSTPEEMESLCGVR